MNRTALFLALLSAFLLISVPRSHADAAAEAAIAPERLTQGKLTPQEYAFKQQVYKLHVAHGVATGRPRIYDLPASDLATIPGTTTVMRKDAAAALGKLLAAARADLAADVAATGTDPTTVDRHTRALRVKDITLNNAYRSASTQFGIWDRNFARYLAATQPDRVKCVGGEFGPAAAELLRNYIGIRVAAPGFSNHQGGIAVDFSLDLKPVDGATNAKDTKTTLGASTADDDPWKQSWFWDWLNRRAGDFGFVAYLPEPWHWEYKPDRVGKGREE